MHRGFFGLVLPAMRRLQPPQSASGKGTKILASCSNRSHKNTVPDVGGFNSHILAWKMHQQNNTRLYSIYTFAGRSRIPPFLVAYFTSEVPQNKSKRHKCLSPQSIPVPVGKTKASIQVSTSAVTVPKWRLDADSPLRICLGA